MLTKICFTCKEEKHVSEFYSNKAKSTGLYGSCKPCFKSTLKYQKSSDYKLDVTAEQLKNETFKTLVLNGISTHYNISDCGRLFITTRGRDAKPSLDQRGYPQLVFNINKVRIGRRIHILVAETFIGPSNGMQVDHIDGNKLNSHVSNLRYVTCLKNIEHADENGLRKAFTHMNHPQRKRILDTRTGKEYESIRHASIELNINYSVLSSGLIRRPDRMPFKKI